MYQETCVLEKYVPGNICTGKLCTRKNVYRGILKKKMVYWKKVYREIYVLENYVQGRLCTRVLEIGKYCTGKICTGKSMYWKIM